MQPLQHLDVAGLGCLILALEVVQDISHAQAVAADLVGVCGADALARRAYLGVALGSLVGRIQQTVRGHDEVGFLGDVQAFFQRMACGFEGFGFGFEKGGVEHHAVADEVHFVALEYAGGDGTEHVLLSVELKRMSGVGAALEAGHYVVSGGQHVDYFAFAFVAPL